MNITETYGQISTYFQLPDFSSWIRRSTTKVISCDLMKWKTIFQNGNYSIYVSVYVSYVTKHQVDFHISQNLRAMIFIYSNLMINVIWVFPMVICCLFFIFMRSSIAILVRHHIFIEADIICLMMIAMKPCTPYNNGCCLAIQLISARIFHLFYGRVICYDPLAFRG